MRCEIGTLSGTYALGHLMFSACAGRGRRGLVVYRASELDGPLRPVNYRVLRAYQSKSERIDVPASGNLA